MDRIQSKPKGFRENDIPILGHDGKEWKRSRNKFGEKSLKSQAKEGIILNRPPIPSSNKRSPQYLALDLFLLIRPFKIHATYTLPSKQSITYALVDECYISSTIIHEDIS
ncbi:hypothetical protein STEG23_000543 [Scotinomys teguina]